MREAEESQSQASPAEYWAESSRPFVALLFVTPLLLCYEVGVLLLDESGARGGADAWLRGVLDLAGFGQILVLPMLVGGLLVAWHHARHEPWQASGRIIAQMWLESWVWGVALLILAQVALWMHGSNSVTEHELVAAMSSEQLVSRALGYLGAGLYEELLFRLLLLSAILAGLRLLQFRRQLCLGCAIVISSLLFAAAHYRWNVLLFGCEFVWPNGEVFAPFSFAFRFLAGSAFALLFARRGFGIAVGAHAAYDMLALLLCGA